MKHITTDCKRTYKQQLCKLQRLFCQQQPLFSLKWKVQGNTHLPRSSWRCNILYLIQHSTDEGTTANRITEYSTANEASKTTTPIPNEETMSDLTRETVKGTSKSTILLDKDSSTKASPVTADEVRKFLNHSFPVGAKVHSFYSCRRNVLPWTKMSNSKWKPKIASSTTGFLTQPSLTVIKLATTGSSFRKEKACSALYVENMTQSIFRTNARNLTVSLWSGINGKQLKNTYSSSRGWASEISFSVPPSN